VSKIIAFSLWGDNPKYCVGAVKNAQLARLYYPDWIARFYVANTTPQSLIEQLQHHKAEVVVKNAESGDWHGMFWRFEPASDDEVDAFISRDCDSRLSEREAVAVNEWLASPKLVHSMADHPYHFDPRLGLMGGMFGMKRHACPQMTSLITQFRHKYPVAWQCDQDFLKQYIYPLVAHKIYASSDIHAGCNRFALARLNGSFVGEIIGPNDEVLHPEHREMRDAVSR
jgi:hypothetical protein